MDAQPALIALGQQLTSGGLFLHVRTFCQAAVFTDWYAQHKFMATSDHTRAKPLPGSSSTTNLSSQIH